MALMYKAYLYDRKVNKPKEIRRFSVDHDVSSSYEYLRKKVASVFPDLSNENFHLQWHDSEGDLIWFNSDEELIEALSEHQGGLFKLMIQEKSDGTESNENKDDSSENEGGNYRRCGGGRRGNWWGRRQQGRGGWGSGWGGWCSPEFQQQMFNHFAGYQQQQQQQQSGCPKKDNGNGSKDESKSSEGSSNAEQQQQAFPSGEEYLKNVGSAVSDFLKPFGIDVDVSVDHNGIRTSVNTRKPETAEKKEEQPTCSKNMDGQNKSANEKAAPSSEDQGEQTPPPPSPFTVPVKVIHESKIKKDDVKREKVSSQSSDEGEWTMVKEDEDTTGSKPYSSGKEEKAEKQETSKEKQSTSPERKRQPGPLDLLLAMGFKDENGSLERLLNACQNDIGKVLENMEKMNFKM